MEPAGWERRYDGTGYQKALEPPKASRSGGSCVLIGGSIVCAGWLLG